MMFCTYINPFPSQKSQEYQITFQPSITTNQSSYLSHIFLLHPIQLIYLLPHNNNPIIMSIRKLIGLQNGVQDLIVEVMPRMLTLPKNIRNFVLYLQKGMQVIGRFQSDQTQTLRDNLYRFKSTQPTEFRVYNLTHSTYSWSLYSLNVETKQEILEDTASFSIERTIKLYQVELLEKEREVQTSYRDKKITKQIVLQFWNKAKKDMKTFRSNQKCVFPLQNSQIQFQIEIKNVLDLQQQRIYQQQQRRQLRRAKSDQASRINSNSSNIKDASFDQDIILNLPPYSSNLQEATYNKIGQNQEPQVYYIRNPENDSKDVVSYGVGDNEMEYNATVKVVNPLGEEIDADKNQVSLRGNQRQESQSSSNYYVGQQPLKKFSLLSDIIQASQQGSSSYGHHQARSSAGFKNLALRKDGTIDMILEKQDDRSHAITKVRTLPYESHHHLVVGDEFRRAQTAQKSVSDVQSQIHEQSIIQSPSPDIKTPPPQRIPVNSGDPYGKWIILSALIIVILVMFGAWPNNKVNSSKKRNRV